MFIRPALLLSALSIGSALCSISIYGQCGGDDIVWPDTCSDGLSCVYYNFWYSQCLPVEATATGDEPSSTGVPGSRRVARSEE
ncbi:hypothetical protein B0H13DRAFT_2035019 [Mycena leptocephala]|nr:hypothetical protein B0H13DRAFT_2035019 [Mycena leptocephala]